jgi:hypothetical protein
MQQGFNRFVKFLVSLLFLLEFLSPAFSYSNISIPAKPLQGYILPANEHPYFLFAFFSNQLNEKEEEVECHKWLLPLASKYSTTGLGADHFWGSYGFALKKGPLHSQRVNLFTWYCDYRL